MINSFKDELKKLSSDKENIKIIHRMLSKSELPPAAKSMLKRQPLEFIAALGDGESGSGST